MNHFIKFAFAGLLIGLLSHSCKESEDVDIKANYQELAEKQISLKYTNLFSIHRTNDYTKITLKNAWNTQEVFATYILVPKNKSIPKNLTKKGIIIRTPVDSIVTLASPHIGLFSAFSAEDKIIGVGETKYIYNKKVQRRIKDGMVKEVGIDQNLNIELLIDFSPGIVMATGYQQLHDNLTLASEYGIPIVYNVDWMEQSPLARAEWIKFVGAFLNRNQEADSIFNHIESAYIKTAQKIKQVKQRPKVILGRKFKGTWYMPGGESYIGQFLKDAGADYYWASDTSRGSMPLSFEEVVDKQLDAEIWLNPGSALSTSQILEEDERYGIFTALQNKEIYNHSKQLIATGANGYWETSALNPHLVLSDMIHILHPNVLPNYELVYYEKLE